MIAIDDMFRQPLAQAVGWALLQFVWQGAVIGAIAAALLALLQRSAPDVRYVVASVALALMLTWLASEVISRNFVQTEFFSRPLAVLGVVGGAVIGVLWLSTIPPTSALIAIMFGSRWLTMLLGVSFFSHQIGGFLGVWLGGIVFEKFGSYTPIWWLSILFGVLSALINLPIVEKPVPRAVAQPA